MIDKHTYSVLRARTGLSLEEVAEETGYSIRTVYRWESGRSIPRKSVLDRLHELSVSANSSSYNHGFTFIDLFAGIGGMRRGFEDIGGKCIFTSEWDRFSQKTYLANFPSTHEIAGDITKIDAQKIPSHDVLLAGFPCQPFSIAGVSKKNSLGRAHGFKDATQGTLFFDIVRILDHHRPAAFLLENVKNLERHDSGKTFKVITGALTELGYHFRWRVIDARTNVPQHRERIFIVGFRDIHNFNMADIHVPSRTQSPCLGSILHPENGTEPEEVPFTSGSQAHVSDKYTLSDKLWTYLQNYAEKHRRKGNGFGYGLVGPEDTTRTLSARYYKDGSEILLRRKTGNPRRLTPRECSRLMGFDRPAESTFRIPVSDTQAYKQFGNAVVVPVVKSVARFMQPYIQRSMSGVRDQLELDFSDAVYST
ncbi:MAG: DNA (cytosine-5-)-methyltransferase [Candidatus Thorarchaeota archaeon]